MPKRREWLWCCEAVWETCSSDRAALRNTRQHLSWWWEQPSGLCLAALSMNSLIPGCLVTGRSEVCLCVCRGQCKRFQLRPREKGSFVVGHLQRLMMRWSEVHRRCRSKGRESVDVPVNRCCSPTASYPFAFCWLLTSQVSWIAESSSLNLRTSILQAILRSSDQSRFFCCFF